MYDELQELLERMEAELRTLGLWELEAPPAEDLNSQAPFCYDTLAFHQWLQWIFIPRTAMLVRNQHELPGTSDIHTLAEYYFETQGIEAGRLLRHIARVDRLLTDGRGGQR